MINVVIAFIAGLIIGSVFGVFAIALTVASKGGDDHDGF